ncbi:hypothetical protein M433DRAFT_144516 [Acidomyces richmondensis BFW]|nr:hypothetical protein M433DRAFT_144516 [Acidomyces richmondensis BFW]
MSPVHAGARCNVESCPWPPNQVAGRVRCALPPSMRGCPGEAFDLHNDQPPPLDRELQMAADRLVFLDDHEPDVGHISPVVSVDIMNGAFQQVPPVDRGFGCLPMWKVPHRASVLERFSLPLPSADIALFREAEVGYAADISTPYHQSLEAIPGEGEDREAAAAAQRKRKWAKRMSLTVQYIGRRLKRKMSLRSGPDSAVEIDGCDHSDVQKTSQSNSPEPKMSLGESDADPRDGQEEGLSPLSRRAYANGELPTRGSLNNTKCDVPLLPHQSSHCSISSETTLVTDLEADRAGGAPLERFTTVLSNRSALSNTSGTAQSFQSFGRNLTGEPKQIIEADGPALAMEERSELIARHLRRKAWEGVFFEEEIERVFTNADGNNTTEAEGWRASKFLIEENQIIRKMSQQEFEDAVRTRELRYHTRLGRFRYRVKHLVCPWQI